MRLHRKGQRMLGAGRVQVLCYNGPLHMEKIWVPEGTREFFAVDREASIALTPDELLPVWRYLAGPPGLFSGHQDTEL